MKKLQYLLFLITVIALSCSETSDENSITPIASFPYAYELHSFQDLDMPRRSAEDVRYDLASPISSISWNADTYLQSDTTVIWVSPYGPRYLSGNTTSEGQDMHGGLDTNKKFISGSENYDCDHGNPAKVYSICDGTVYNFREEKNDVFIECDQLLAYADGSSSPLRNVYRHLSTVVDEVKVEENETYRIGKGEYIGEMGAKAANNCHLHFDLLDQDFYLHPGRLWNPEASPYYRALKDIKDIDIRVLDYTPVNKQAYFRIAIRGNVLSTVEIRIANHQMNLEEVLNFENRQKIRETSERDNTIFEKWSLFAYPFNGYTDADTRYDRVKDEISAMYPGSTSREKYYPVSASDHELYGEASLVYDLVINDVEESNLPYFKITLCDVYGNCIATREY